MSSLCQESLKRLKHPRNDQIEFRGKCFWVKNGDRWKRLRGIHRAIKDFFPPLDPKHLRSSSKKIGSKKGLTDAEMLEKATKTEYASGLEGGTQVHSEIEIYCNERAEWDRRVEITIEYLKRKKIAKEVLRTGKPQHGAGSWFRGVLPNKPAAMLHPCSVVVVTELKKHHMEPVIGEWKIFSPGMYATKVDIICVNTLTRELVLVELKTGYVDTFRQWTAPMKGELKNLLSNSALSQAILQVFIPKCTLEYEYGIRASAVVMRVTKNEAEIIHIPNQILIPSLRLYKWLKTEIIKNKEK